MKRTRARVDVEKDAGLPLTGMIDVVFLLLFYFLFTLRPVDALTHLDADRPGLAPGPAAPVVRLGVERDGFRLEGSPVTLDEVRGLTARLGAMNSEQTVLVVSAPDAPHARMVEALDACAAAGLRNLSVLSAR